jgi:hypothetical protein
LYNPIRKRRKEKKRKRKEHLILERGGRIAMGMSALLGWNG